MTHMRSKSCYCKTCKGTSYVVADLDAGTIKSVTVTPLCHWPAKCPEEFVRGVFDRQFGSKIIIPHPGAPM